MPITSYSGIYTFWGPPGTGKTFAIASQVKRISEDAALINREPPVILCSLTRTAAQELAGRVKGIRRERVGTLHAHAFHALSRPEMAESHLEDWNTDNESFRLSVASKEDFEGDAGGDRDGETLGDEMYRLYALMRARLTSRQLWPPTVQTFAEHWEGWKKARGVIDFSDLIDVAFEDVPQAPLEPEVIIADEAQDNSAAEFRLLRKWGEAAGALMLAGDPYQALYCWRGAHPDIFIDPSIPADHKKLLRQSYRVPAAAHRLAMNWITNLSNYTPIDYRPTDVEGSVDHLPFGTWRQPEPIIHAALEELQAGKSVMIMGSCGYIMGPVVMRLREMGVPFSNPWRQKRGDWNPLSRMGGTSTVGRILSFLSPDPGVYGRDAHRWSHKELALWIDMVQSKGLMLHGAKKQIETMAAEDGDGLCSYDELLNLFDSEPCNWLWDAAQRGELAAEDESFGTMTDELLDWLGAALLPSKRSRTDFPFKVMRQRGAKALLEPPRLYVGTINSFKGAEADVTFVMPDLSKAGVQEWHSREGRDSVVRLFYVAFTRARERVVLCKPADPHGAIPTMGLNAHVLN